MAINVNYSPDVRALGQVAQQAGEGQYRQKLNQLATSDENRRVSAGLNLAGLQEGARRTNLNAEVSRANLRDQLVARQQQQQQAQIANENMAMFQADVRRKGMVQSAQIQQNQQQQQFQNNKDIFTFQKDYLDQSNYEQVIAQKQQEGFSFSQRQQTKINELDGELSTADDKFFSGEISEPEHVAQKRSINRQRRLIMPTTRVQTPQQRWDQGHVQLEDGRIAYDKSAWGIGMPTKQDSDSGPSSWEVIKHNDAREAKYQDDTAKYKKDAFDAFIDERVETGQFDQNEWQQFQQSIQNVNPAPTRYWEQQGQGNQGQHPAQGPQPTAPPKQSLSEREQIFQDIASPIENETLMHVKQFSAQPARPLQKSDFNDGKKNLNTSSSPGVQSAVATVIDLSNVFAGQQVPENLLSEYQDAMLTSSLGYTLFPQSNADIAKIPIGSTYKHWDGSVRARGRRETPGGDGSFPDLSIAR